MWERAGRAIAAAAIRSFAFSLNGGDLGVEALKRPRRELARWRVVDEFGGLYEVSDDARIRRRGTTRELVQYADERGYFRVRLTIAGKSIWRRVHRLVAAAFVPNPDGLLTVNHKDEDKSNNRSYNLEWADQGYQNTYGTGLERRALARSKPIIQSTKDGAFIRKWTSSTEAGQALHIDSSAITKCCKGKAASAGGFSFQYENTKDNKVLKWESQKNIESLAHREQGKRRRL